MLYIISYYIYIYIYIYIAGNSLVQFFVDLHVNPSE